MRIRILSLVILLTAIFFATSKIITRFKKCGCTVHDPKTLQNVTCFAKPINRTTTLINMTANIIRLVENVYVNIQMHKKTDVVYRPFLINATDSYCDFFGKNKASVYLRMFGRLYLPYTNLNHTCPYFGWAYIKDFPFNNDLFPSIWPPGEFRVNVLAFEKDVNIITMSFYLEIKEIVGFRN